jgi:hypothetical protein
MISYSKEDHLNFVNEELFRLCIISGLSYETVTRENYDEVLRGLQTSIVDGKEFHRLHYSLRYLYFNKLMIESME